MKRPLTLTILSLYISLAYAEPTDTQISSTAEIEDGVTELGPIEITATRGSKQKLEIPETVEVIAGTQIEKQNIGNIQELVRHTLGVAVARRSSGADPFANLSGFNIRGVGGNRVQVQVDGSRIIEEIQDGNRNFMDMSHLKSVEILKGPGSVLWGADALAGVVKFRTLDPYDLLQGKSWATKVNLGYGSVNQEFNQGFSVASQISENNQVLLSATHRRYHENKLNNARADGGVMGCPRVADAIACDRLNPLSADVYNVLGKWVWQPNEYHEVKVTGEHFISDSDAKQLYDYGQQANGSFNGDYDRHQKQTRSRLSIEDTWTPELNWLNQAKIQLSYSPQKREFWSHRQQINTAKKPVNTYSSTNYEETFLQADVQLESQFNTGPVSHTLTYGFQGDHTKTDYENLTVTNTNGVIVAKPAGGFNFANATTRRADLYLQDEMRLFDDRLVLTPGIRWATYNINPKPDVDYVSITGKEPRKIDSKEWVPQIGAIFKLDDHYSLYARYAEGFKMPTAQQLFTSVKYPTFNMIPNPNLKPESVKSYEVGLRGSFNNGWFSVGGFYSDYKDYIQNLVVVGPNDFSYANINRVKISGIEASGNVDLSPTWSVHAQASYQYGKQQKGNDAQYVYFDSVSPLTASVGVKWKKPEWKFDAEVIGTVARGVNKSSNPDYYKPRGYAVVDTYFNWQLAKNVQLNASIQNLFDRRYFSAPLATTYSYKDSNSSKATNPLELQVAPGRAFGLSLVANF